MLHMSNTEKLFLAGRGAERRRGGGNLSRALPKLHEAGPPKVASAAWQGFREVGRRAGRQPVPEAQALRVAARVDGDI